VFARRLRHHRPRASGQWHLDEMVIRIHGEQMYLWRAVDHEGEILDMLVQRRRDKRAAVKLMRKLLKGHGFAPAVIVTDMCGWPPRCKGKDDGMAESRQRACVRPLKCGHTTAGPDEIRGSGPYQAHALEAHLGYLGVPISSSDRRAITSISADAPRSPTARRVPVSHAVL
jgi:hypothetical protein